jgi:heat shock protein HslJ
MYCGGSIESDYFTLIARPLTYTIAGPNLLVFSGEDTLVFGPDSVEDGLFSTTWTLEYVGSPGSQPESPPASETYSLNFDMDGPDVSGMVNCNNCFGQYDVAGEHIDIRLAMCTSKGCMSSVLQSSYSSLLAKASTFEIEGKRLFLFAESDTLVYTSSPNVVSLVESSPRSRMSIGRSLSASSAAVYDMRGRAVEASGSGSGYSVKLIVPKNGNAPKIILSK